MNKAVFPIALIFLHMSNMAWGGSYLIQLKNGGEVRTSGYWEEGDEIKFYIYGGVAGIQKGFVNEIKETNIVLRDHFEQRWSDSGDKGKLKEAPHDERSSQDQSSHSDTKSAKTMIDADYYRQQRLAIEQEIEEVSQAYEEASRRKDAEAKEKARQERLELSRQLIDLTEELKHKNSGAIPDWWR